MEKKISKGVFFFRRKNLPLPAQNQKPLFVRTFFNSVYRRMAHHRSALKRIRQTEKRRLQNRYYKKTARTAIKNLRGLKAKAEAETFLPKVISMIDRLAKRGSIHRNKAANLKSGLMKFVNGLA